MWPASWILRICLFMVLAASASAVFAAEPGEKSLEDELPRIPPVEAKDTLANFRIAEGFRLELVASEPTVFDPVDACFDADGRMYVVQMRDYPFLPEQRPSYSRTKPQRGSIQLLEDRDNDGIYETSRTFADDLTWPTSCACWNGGIFVASAPDVIYLKDTDGDGKADLRETVYSGFGRQNVQGLLNNFKWGLDNRLYLSSGSNGGALTHRGKERFPLRGGAIVRIDPRDESVQALPGGSQFGHSFDDWGDRFVCSNSNHIQQALFTDPVLSQNPFLPAPEATRSIAKEGGAAPVFRQSQPEPWRLVRTRRRAADPELSKRLPQSELVPTGFFTSATGVTIYRGGVNPPEFQGQAFIGDVGGNLIHRKRLIPQGVGFTAERADRDREFITSNDNWFRPANFVNAPDGTLYILDMYRETIEHPASIPEDIKRHLDLESGNDRGRIYRLVPAEYKRTVPPQLARKTSVELVAELESPNAWNRETAQRLLFERQDRSAVEALRKLARESNSPLARTHTLWTLEGLNALTSEVVLPALRDENAHVREQAVQVARRISSELAVAHGLRQMADEESPRVRFQLLLALAELRDLVTNATLFQMVQRRSSENDLNLAWLAATNDREAVFMELLASSDNFVSQPAAAGLLGKLTAAAAARNESGAARVFAALLNIPAARRGLQADLLQKLGEGLSRRKSSVPQLEQQLDQALRERAEQLFAQARGTAANENASLSDRTTAITLLAYGNFDGALKTLTELLAPQSPPELQTAAIRALANFSQPEAATSIIEAWNGFGPGARRAAADVLLQTAPRASALLAALAKGAVKRTELDRDQKQFLLNHPQEGVRTTARKLLADDAAGDRSRVVAAYQSALSVEGNAERGRMLFQKHCAACHQVGQTGHVVGPNLASVSNKAAGDLLISVLDPNREALPTFNSYTLVTTQGKILTGIIAAESAASVTLKRAEGQQDVVLRGEIEQLASNGISLMPEGFEKEITPAQLADLIEFIRTLPKSP